MKFFALCMLLSAPASAKPNLYLVQNRLFVGEKLIAGPSVVVNEGLAAEVSQKTVNRKDGTPEDGDYSIKILAAEPTEGDGRILVKYDLRYVSRERTVKAASRFLAKSGEEVSLPLGKGTNDVQLKMTVTRNGVIQ